MSVGGIAVDAAVAAVSWHRLRRQLIVTNARWNGKERRRAPRTKVDYHARFESGEGTVANISATGLYLVTTAVVAVGALLRVRIDLPGTNCGELLVRARVRRVDHLERAIGVAMTIEGFAFASLPMPMVEASHPHERHRSLRVHNRKP